MNSQNEYCFVVDRAYPRLDRYVSEQHPALSRTQAQKLIREGHVKVNGRAAKAGLKLEVGDKVTLTIPPVAPSPLLPEDIPLDIIYEDDDLLVVDKPAGLTVHPAPGHPAHTLVNAVLSHLSELSTESLRPGIVHRLDKETSGLMLVAKNNATHMNLARQFKARTIVKAYLVLVKGHVTPQDGVIDAPIGRDSGNRKRMAVVAESRGRAATTQYHVIRYIGDYTLLEVRPKTGRTHQIRVHLSAIGYPVVGDKTYGVKSSHLSRQFLHAFRLGFNLPSSGKYVEFESKLPPDLTQALERTASSSA